MRRSYEARDIGDHTLFLSALMPIEQLVAQLNAFQPDIISGYLSIIYTLAYEQKEGRLHIHPLMIDYDYALAVEAAVERIQRLVAQNKLEHVRITPADLPLVRTRSGKFRIAFKEFV